jgi:Cu/Ag efflux pump CusA
MIDGLIRWSLQHRATVVAIAAAFLIWGGWTATRIPLDVLPDLTAPSVTILAEAPGMDPLEIEALVTFPERPASVACGRPRPSAWRSCGWNSIGGRTSHARVRR